MSLPTTVAGIAMGLVILVLTGWLLWMEAMKFKRTNYDKWIKEQDAKDALQEKQWKHVIKKMEGKS